MPILQQPEAYLSRINELLDGDGGFKSENTLKFAQSFVDAFLEHIDRY
jgi:chromate reductase